MAATNIGIEMAGIGKHLASRLLKVPVYQRSYAWKKDQIEDFWTDLRSAFSQTPREYFLGTIVLTKATAPSRGFIIDGQQRFATTAILLAAIRDTFRARGDAKRVTSVQSQFLSSLDRHTADEVPRVFMNSDDDTFFRRFIIEGDLTIVPSRESHTLIREAYATLLNGVTGTANDAGSNWTNRLVEWLDFIEEQVTVVVLEVPTEADAYLIFETLNDRGADLTIADLLKNYLFGHAGSHLDVVRDGWMMALGALDISAENTMFTTFLRHYWSSRHGAIRERDLYKGIKDHVSTETQAVSFVDELQKASRLYAALLSSEHEHWSSFGFSAKENVETLFRLELEQNRPLLLAALQHFPEGEIKRLLRALVGWSVRGLIVGGIGGGTAEKAYCAAAVKVRSGGIKTTDGVLDELARIVPSDDEFKASFQVAQIPKASLARYYLIALERGKTKIAEPELVPNANEEQVNLEHVLPKNASAADWGQFSADERRDFVHRLGNMALLAKGPNGRIGNKIFAVKKPILAGSLLTLTKEIGANNTWTVEEITKRQVELANIAVGVWPRKP